MGADILKEPMEIRDWIASIVPAGVSEVTVGMYTYLDGEAHVRVSLGCDLIMNGLKTYWQGQKVVRFAYLGSCSCPSAITKAAYDAIDDNRATSPPQD